MADNYQATKDSSTAARCAETRTQQAFMVVRIVFMLVGIVAMLLGMYFSTTFLDSIAAFFACGGDGVSWRCASARGRLRKREWRQWWWWRRRRVQRGGAVSPACR